MTAAESTPANAACAPAGAARRDADAGHPATDAGCPSEDTGSPWAEAWYVYYRVDPAHQALARERVAALLHAVQAATGVRGRPLSKQGEPLLWMEVYEPVRDAEAFQAALTDAVARLDFDALLRPGTARILERFRPCA